MKLIEVCVGENNNKFPYKRRTSSEKGRRFLWWICGRPFQEIEWVDKTWIEQTDP